MPNPSPETYISLHLDDFSPRYLSPDSSSVEEFIPRQKRSLRSKRTGLRKGGDRAIRLGDRKGKEGICFLEDLKELDGKNKRDAEECLDIS